MVTTYRTSRMRASIAIKEVGMVEEVKKSIVRISGLDSCLNGQVIEFDTGIKGMIMGFDERGVLGLILGYEAKVRTGAKVFSQFEPFRIPSGEGFLGRVIDVFGNPCDNKGPIIADAFQDVFKEAPETMDRGEAEVYLETGTRIIDSTIPMSKGQRQLIIGDRATGKTTIALDAILHQKGRNIVCIYCCTGKSNASLMKVLRVLHSQGALDHTIVIQALASSPCGQQYLAPYAAHALGEYFMYKGQDVLLVLDDLTRHAWAYRELSLLMERPPGREAYPGDIYYVHSRLVERSGMLTEELNGGSMSSFSIVETIQGDITGFIPSNLVSMTDGQILLSAALFTSGTKPAVDFGQSVSIIGSRSQLPVLKELAQPLRALFTKYTELLALTKIKTTLSAEAEAILNRGGALSQIFSQDQNSPSSLEEQVILLYALSKGVLDKLSAVEMRIFRDTIGKNVRAHHPEIIDDLTSGKPKLSDATIRALDSFFEKFIHKQEPVEKQKAASG